MQHPPPRVPVEDVVRRPVDRRVFLEWAGKGALAGTALLGAWGAPARALAGSGSPARAGGGSSAKRLKVGVIVPTSGIGQFLGEIVQRSLKASKQHIDDAGLFKGSQVDYEIVNAPAEKFAEGTTQAYNKLVADPDVIGILWCTPLGLSEARKQVQRDQIPVIGVYNDLWSARQLYPDGPERSIFQLLLPDRLAIDVLARYAARDRGYRRVGLISDSTTYAAIPGYFRAAAKREGLRVAGVEEFQIFSGDYGAQLQRLKQQRSEALFVWGLSDNTAGIVRGLAGLDASYVDTPTAKSGSGWHPQVVGSPGGTGEKKWAELAGDDAKAGSLTAWYLGGLVGGPEIPIRRWLRAAGEQPPTGGEETPANGFWALLQAAKRAGSTDRRAMVTELERLRTRFASLPYGFAPKRHLSITPDQVCLISLERWSGPAPTDPPYALGREWETTFPEVSPEYVGPTHLVRPTLAANRRANPEYLQVVLDQDWGTQCTKKPPTASGADVTMTKACKIH